LPRAEQHEPRTDVSEGGHSSESEVNSLLLGEPRDHRDRRQARFPAELRDERRLAERLGFDVMNIVLGLEFPILARIPRRGIDAVEDPAERRSACAEASVEASGVR